MKFSEHLVKWPTFTVQLACLCKKPNVVLLYMLQFQGNRDIRVELLKTIAVESVISPFFDVSPAWLEYSFCSNFLWVTGYVDLKSKQANNTSRPYSNKADFAKKQSFLEFSETSSGEPQELALSESIPKPDEKLAKETSSFSHYNKKGQYVGCLACIDVFNPPSKVQFSDNDYQTHPGVHQERIQKFLSNEQGIHTWPKMLPELLDHYINETLIASLYNRGKLSGPLPPSCSEAALKSKLFFDQHYITFDNIAFIKGWLFLLFSLNTRIHIQIYILFVLSQRGMNWLKPDFIYQTVDVPTSAVSTSFIGRMVFSGNDAVLVGGSNTGELYFWKRADASAFGTRARGNSSATTTDNEADTDDDLPLSDSALPNLSNSNPTS
ncbi:hypothetical protein RFI_10947, partial [Reticulomyxa filosa]